MSFHAFCFLLSFLNDKFQEITQITLQENSLLDIAPGKLLRSAGSALQRVPTMCVTSGAEDAFGLSATNKLRR